MGQLEHGRLDILVNVVGAYSGGKENSTYPVEEWEQHENEDQPSVGILMLPVPPSR